MYDTLRNLDTELPIRIFDQSGWTIGVSEAKQSEIQEKFDSYMVKFESLVELKYKLISENLAYYDAAHSLFAIGYRAGASKSMSARTLSPSYAADIINAMKSGGTLSSMATYKALKEVLGDINVESDEIVRRIFGDFNSYIAPLRDEFGNNDTYRTAMKAFMDVWAYSSAVVQSIKELMFFSEQLVARSTGCVMSGVTAGVLDAGQSAIKVFDMDALQESDFVVASIYQVLGKNRTKIACDFLLERASLMMGRS